MKYNKGAYYLLVSTISSSPPNGKRLLFKKYEQSRDYPTWLVVEGMWRTVPSIGPDTFKQIGKYSYKKN
jgi:hypothetical protein